MAIQEALAAPAIGPRSEIDLNALFVGRSPRPAGLRTLVNVECGYRDPYTLVIANHTNV